jgi:hypothetical protein
MSRIVHMCIDIRGMLKWPKRRLRNIVSDDHGRYLSADAARDWLLDQLAEGKRVLPLADPCEGFDYQKGCPGHERPDQ